jgi:hypothetical protein
MTELKPCPICGSLPVRYIEDDDYLWLCPGRQDDPDYCFIAGHRSTATVEEWNRRAK